MSKLKALITTLILSTSSAAMADTSVSFSAHASAQVNLGGPMVRDHRQTTYLPTSYRPYQTTSQWRALSSSMAANTGRNVVRLEHPMAMSWLKLQATAGVAFIDTVTIRFANGSRQTIDLDATVDASRPAQFAIQSNGAVTSITVTSNSNRFASFQLFGYTRADHPTYPGPRPLPRPPMPSMYPIGQDLVFENGDGRKFITVGADKGRFGTVRLTSTEGRVFVQQLLVNFSDGSQQIIRSIDTSLRAGQHIDLRLDGAGAKRIERVVIYTDPAKSPGALSIFAL